MFYFDNINKLLTCILFLILKINFVLLLKKIDLVLILLNNKINKKTKLMINSIVFKIAMYRVQIFCRAYMCVISVGCFFLIFVTQYYTMFHEVMEFLLKKTKKLHFTNIGVCLMLMTSELTDPYTLYHNNVILLFTYKTGLLCRLTWLLCQWAD